MICLKISTFVVSTTTDIVCEDISISCDLLENIYLCGINNNVGVQVYLYLVVVICLKISTFVVSTTTSIKHWDNTTCCDLLENIYLCGINNNGRCAAPTLILVVICLKISTFVVSTTTSTLTLSCGFSCDLLENIYLCGINNNVIKFQTSMAQL